MSLHAIDLSVGYGRRTVGRGLSFTIGQGGVVALLGPNGCGKTTLLRTLLGLLEPLAGRVELDGRPLNGVGIAERARRMAYVPQSHHATFGFSVREAVLLGRTAHMGLWARPGPKDRAVAQACIERLGVAHLAERPLHRISGGERQLALIARALAQEPGLVLLDEPTASLDFGNQGRVLREMRTLAAQGLGVIFTTHDPNHAVRYADRALLMRSGSILAHAQCDALAEDSLKELCGADVVAFRSAAASHPVFVAE